ncbi:MAG: hypothetical protein ACRCS8_06105 [Brevinema sp.]
MQKIGNALFLLFFSFSVFFVYTYLQTPNLELVRSSTAYYFFPIAGASLFISLITFSRTKSSLFSCLIFSIVVVGMYFVLNTNPRTYKNNQNATFSDFHTLPQKKGIVVQNSVNCISFGVIARADKGNYLIKNAFYRSKRIGDEGVSFFAPTAKIINNQLTLYNTYILTENKITNPKKNFETSISFDSDVLFELWNETDRINVSKALPYLNSLVAFRKVIFLSLGEYLAGFFMLLFLASIGLTFQNTAVFHYKNALGIAASYSIGYILASMMLFYGSLLVQSFVNLNII